MTPLLKDKFLFWLNMVVIWTLAMGLLTFLRYYGIAEFSEVEAKEIFDSSISIRLSLIMGVMIGTFYFLSETGFDTEAINRLSFGRILVLKTVVNFVLLQIAFWAMILRATALMGETLDYEMASRVMASKVFGVVFIWFIVVSTCITFYRQVSRKIGGSILQNMLLGKYHKPREEERIFLFIDLQSSTTIAEKLGHLKYSQLIRDCFSDITTAVLKTKAEIYQYVGDEVVLCWKSKQGLQKNRCLKAIFLFQETLDKRADYYEKQYNLQPFFKAGAHIGTTTVAEVGVIKRDIAYYGDVLNTAARIQGQCNGLGEQLLISEHLRDRLENTYKYRFVNYDKQVLKGKKDVVNVKGVKGF